MLIHVATVGDDDASEAARQRFLHLARCDRIGRHRAEPDPGRADAVLFVDSHLHEEDRFGQLIRRHRVKRSFPRKVAVYDERDVPYFSVPGIYVSATAAWARRYRGAIVGGPYVDTGDFPNGEDRVPDLLFAFRGGRTHPLRDRVLALAHPRAIIEDSGTASRKRARYADLIHRAKFVLCPRGYGASSIRIFETIAAGRVPVVIGDDWLPPPRVSWDKGIVRVPEARVEEVGTLLESIEHRWQILRMNCEVISDALREERLWDHYAASIAQIRRVALHPWWFDRRVARAILGR